MMNSMMMCLSKSQDDDSMPNCHFHESFMTIVSDAEHQSCVKGACARAVLKACSSNEYFGRSPLRSDEPFRVRVRSPRLS
jgi:hypothetical protein